MITPTNFSIRRPYVTLTHAPEVAATAVSISSVIASWLGVVNDALSTIAIALSIVLTVVLIRKHLKE